MAFQKNNLSITEMAALAKQASSMSEFLRLAGLTTCSGNHQTYRKKLAEWNVDVTHWRGRAIATEKMRAAQTRNKIPLSELLVENSKVNGSHLKERLFAEGVLVNRCYNKSCPTLSMQDWCGLDLKLQLDHINGVRTDNRVENLRLLCPNCHSLTDTYAGKKNKITKVHKLCCDCGKSITKQAQRCDVCCKKIRNVDSWPSLETLLYEISKANVSRVARKFGKSFNALKKHLVKHNAYQNTKR